MSAIQTSAEDRQQEVQATRAPSAIASHASQQQHATGQAQRRRRLRPSGDPRRSTQAPPSTQSSSAITPEHRRDCGRSSRSIHIAAEPAATTTPPASAGTPDNAPLRRNHSQPAAASSPASAARTAMEPAQQRRKQHQQHEDCGDDALLEHAESDSVGGSGLAPGTPGVEMVFAGGEMSVFTRRSGDRARRRPRWRLVDLALVEVRPETVGEVTSE